LARLHWSAPDLSRSKQHAVITRKTGCFAKLLAYVLFSKNGPETKVVNDRSSAGQADKSDDRCFQSDELSTVIDALTHFDFGVSHVGPI